MASNRQLAWGPGAPSEADLASWVLWEAGAVAIEERDAGDGCVVLIAGFECDAALEAAAVTLSGSRIAVVHDDGRSTWKQFAVPYEVDRIVVVPAWREAPTLGAKVVVTIDPMDAFGLEHITTRTCIALLQPLISDDTRVLDVGCGSGILSVIAAKLGATAVVAIDIDPNAIEATNRNVERNGVHDRVVVLERHLHELGEQQFDLVVANLGGTEIMLRLRQQLVGSVRGGGALCLGGMLAEAVQPVVDAFAWMAPPQIVECEGWACVVGRLR